MLMQDIDRKFSRWLESRPGSLRIVKEAAMLNASKYPQVMKAKDAHQFGLFEGNAPWYIDWAIQYPDEPVYVYWKDGCMLGYTFGEPAENDMLEEWEIRLAVDMSDFWHEFKYWVLHGPPYQIDRSFEFQHSTLPELIIDFKSLPPVQYGVEGGGLLPAGWPCPTE